MKASRAYIASFGTTGVMIAAALLMLTVVSTIVAFNGWPGANGLVNDIESVVVRDQPAAVQIGGPGKVAADAARSAADVAARPAAPAVAAARASTPAAGAPPGALGPGAGLRSRPRPLTQPAPAPTTAKPPAQKTTRPSPVAPVTQQVETLTGNLGDATQTVTGSLGDKVGLLSPGLGQTITQVGDALANLLRNLGTRLNSP